MPKKPLKYLVIPDCGDGDHTPTTPFSLTAEDAGKVLTGRLLAMEHQGYWKDNRKRRVPLVNVTYLVTVDSDEEDESK